MEYQTDVTVHSQVQITNQDNTTTKGRNYTVDAFRLLGAFCIVILHIPSFGDIPGNTITVINELCRWAVPFFFLVGGYYFEIGFRSKPEMTFLRRIKSLLSIFFTSNLVYLVFTLLRRTEPIAILLNTATFLIGTHDHLWFIGSMIFGYIFLWFMLEINAVKLLPYIAAAVLLIVLLTGGYAHFFLPDNVNFRFSRQLMSIPFLITGYLFSRYNLIDRLKLWQGIILVLLGVALQALEQNLIFKYSHNPAVSDLLFGSFLYAAGMFILALKVPMPKNNLITKLGQEYSLIIYLYHPIVISIYFNLVIPHAKNKGQIALILSPIIVFLITLGGVVILRKYFIGLYRLLTGLPWRKVRILSPASR
ncbi:MAG: acyltransferase [Mucilaginibacter sp.]|uniref:acyltransferase n=1 Tax=Mucilaginibacter sp. TaxID=1882438 RepID=UPI003267361C